MQKTKNRIEKVGRRNSHHSPTAPIVIQVSAEAVLPEISILPPSPLWISQIHKIHTARGISPQRFIYDHLPSMFS